MAPAPPVLKRADLLMHDDLCIAKHRLRSPYKSPISAFLSTRSSVILLCPFTPFLWRRAPNDYAFGEDHVLLLQNSEPIEPVIDF